MYAVDNTINTTVIKCLVDGLAAKDIMVSGVVTEKSLAETFAKVYCDAKNMTCNITFGQHIYELQEVNSDKSYIGQIRVACEQDLSFFPYWSTSIGQT
ncbi:MAG: hypothetical protein FWE34_08495 [Defluviitaleaceae bacterium]|nr:hypothetical protein [Defluviitaleaceae bacterium]